ncbi:hypothetical protein DPMN_146873 [Dreissena polymorpha]|uniref:Uncharacterized protein n=2 Tax=Dreissena polymorpha TaxID=45954 RepID=A0A9D4FB48_DREPO|nr:hypothetical protein DPMN_146873 [Dreissena polymorpha]
MSLTLIAVIPLLTTQLLCACAFDVFTGNDADKDRADFLPENSYQSRLREAGAYNSLNTLIARYINRLQGEEMARERELLNEFYPKLVMPYPEDFSSKQDVIGHRQEKRKVFWQPLGYGGSSSGADSDTSSTNGRQMFRYGK